jgi:hypothetical protein
MLDIFNIPDMIGMIGVILILIAYFKLNMNTTAANKMDYLLLNLIGAIFLLVSLYFKWNSASVLIEIAWVIISLIGIWRANFLKK